MRYRSLFFDLDGTLLDTIEDIAFAINEALRQTGFPGHFDRDSAKALIGDGADMLVRRALKEKGEDLQAFRTLKTAYMPLYRDHQKDHAHPFEGMMETLMSLRKNGISLFVVTNKPDHLAKAVVEEKIGKGIFYEILGIKEGEKVKPDPYLVNRIVKEKGLDKRECLYVGDSHVDVETAKNAKMDSCLCLWGYGNYALPFVQEATYSINSPKELLSVVLGKE